MKEVWKHIEGYSDYKISTKGRVKSFKHSTEGRILKFGSATGYLSVNLSNKNVIVNKTIHRLVAQAFIPNPQNKPQVNHKDGNKLNNKVENLEWVTGSQNTKHSFDKGLQKPTRTMKVTQYSKNGKKIKSFESLAEASRYTKIDYTCITMAAAGKRNTAGGFVWKY